LTDAGDIVIEIASGTDEPGRPDALHRLIQRASRERNRLVRTIGQQCLQQLPHYEDLPAALLEEIDRNIDHHLALFHHVTLEIGRSLTGDDLDWSRRTARERANQGVPLGEFLMFFHVGLRVAWEDLIERAGDDPWQRLALLDRVDAVITNQQVLMAALTEAYVRESERLSRFRERDLDDLFRLLLAQDTPTPALELRARSLGIDLAASWSVAIFAPSQPRPASQPQVDPAEAREQIRALEPDLARETQGDVWIGRWQGGLAALVPQEMDPASLESVARTQLGEHGRVGLGEPARNGDLARSGRQALRALELGPSLASSGRVHRYADVAVADLIQTDSETARDFTHHVLGPLAEEDANPTQIETLEALARHGYRIKLAAAELGIHPHTLSYRIGQLRSRLGLDLEDPETRLRLQLALLVRRTLSPGAQVQEE
jgi:sugar diacid utilization regulator